MHRFRPIALLSVAVLLVASPARAAVYDYAVGDFVGRSLRLNVPDDLTFVRGILIWGNGANGDNRGRALNDELVAYAQSLGFCVLATAYWANFTDPNELTTFENGIRQLATQCGHPELVSAPWLPIGHSNGGQMSYGFNALRPERCIATVTSKGAFYNNVRPPPPVLRTPGLLVAGEVDNLLGRTNIKDLFTGNRPRGALWAWVEEEGSGHPENDSPEIIRPFIAECVRLRLPADADPRNGPVTLRDIPEASGWLVEPESYKAGFARIYPYADYPGDRSTAGWLPTERVAMIFRAFASYGKAAGATLEGATGAVAEWGTRITYRVARPTGDWRTLELFEGATRLASFTPDATDLSWTQNAVTPGYLSFHGLVTYRDGTQRTTMPRRVFVKAATDTPPSLEPPVLQATAASTGLASLTWTPCAGATAYRIERSDTGASPWTAVAETTEASFNEFAQLAGCRSWYRVVSRRNNGDLAVSDAVPVASSVIHESTSRLTNLSARARSGADVGALIAGFVHTGGTLRVLARGVGPALANLGVSDPVTDPSLRVVGNDGVQVVANDNWSSDGAEALSAAMASCGAFAVARPSADAAAIASVNSGLSHSLLVENAGPAGTALAEIYALDAASPAKLINLSVRAHLSDGRTVIAGFGVTGSQPVTVLLRAAGPALRGTGVSSPLGDPVITLYQGNRALIENHGWGSAPNAEQTSQAAAQTGAFTFAPGSADAALVVTLKPGSYTLVVSSASGAAGTVLAEVYAVP